MEEIYYVYILACDDGSYYVGSANDVLQRVVRHNAGEGAGWTKDRRPVKLVYQEKHESLLSARQREEQIKGWTRRKKRKFDQRILEKNIKSTSPRYESYSLHGNDCQRNDCWHGRQDKLVD